MILGFGLIALVGCKPAAKTGVRTYTSAVRTDIVAGQGNTTGTPGQPGTNQNNCPAGQSAVGAIYDPTNYSNNSTFSFEDRVKLFLSANVKSSDIGTISNEANASTGVRFQGSIKLDNTGRVVNNQSKINIKIYDSFMAENTQLLAIPINISTASSGQFNLQTGIGFIIFKDTYGEIRLDGKIDSQYFSGSVSYINYKTVNAAAAVASGYLGQFYIAACGMIQQ